jgi:hypothetical protein
LNDHLAGSVAGIEVAQKLAKNNAGTALGVFMAGLADDIEADRATLQKLMERLGVEKQGAKQLATWVAEKATRLRFSRAITGSPELSRLFEMEMLSIGIHGKRALWRALGASRDTHAELKDLDIDTLTRRAEDQLASLEPHRLEAAAAAFSEDRAAER